jgi:Tfp pilus assembly protein PilN
VVDRTTRDGVRMIRANLLPRPKESISFFGLRVDSEYAREAIAALGLSVLVAAIGFSIENFRVSHLEVDIADQERAIDARSIERASAKDLALATARYERIDRDARLYRSSGNAAAVQVARIGNRIPKDVWLDTMEHTGSGFTVSGDSQSIGDIGTAIAAFAGAPDIQRADLLSIDGTRSSTDSATFRADLILSPEVPR